MIQTFMCSGYFKLKEEDEDELADAHTETDSYQLSIKEDLFGFVGRSLIS
jgi:hypothetical protein